MRHNSLGVKIVRTGLQNQLYDKLDFYIMHMASINGNNLLKNNKIEDGLGGIGDQNECAPSTSTWLLARLFRFFGIEDAYANATQAFASTCIFVRPFVQSRIQFFREADQAFSNGDSQFTNLVFR